MMSRAAQTHLAGHMRPAGRVFETPGLVNKFLDVDYVAQSETANIDKP